MKYTFLFALGLIFLTGSYAQVVPFHFALVSDTHIGSPNGSSEQDLRRTVADINQQKDLAFVVITGDMFRCINIGETFFVAPLKNAPGLHSCCAQYEVANQSEPDKDQYRINSDLARFGTIKTGDAFPEIAPETIPKRSGWLRGEVIEFGAVFIMIYLQVAHDHYSRVIGWLVSRESRRKKAKTQYGERHPHQ